MAKRSWFSARVAVIPCDSTAAQSGQTLCETEILIKKFKKKITAYKNSSDYQLAALAKTNLSYNCSCSF